VFCCMGELVSAARELGRVLTSAIVSANMSGLLLEMAVDVVEDGRGVEVGWRGGQARPFYRGCAD